MDAASVPIKHDALGSPLLVSQRQTGPVTPYSGEFLDEILFGNTQKGCDPGNFRIIYPHITWPLATCRAALADKMIPGLAGHEYKISGWNNQIPETMAPPDGKQSRGN